MSPAEWLARFAARDAANVAGQVAERERISTVIELKRESNSRRVAPVVVLAPGRELDSDSPEAEAAARSAKRIYIAALGAGWRARMVVSFAIDPVRGPLEVVTVRFRRHDEAGFAAWHGGSFEHAWYVSPAGFEPLGAKRLGAEVSVAPWRDVASLTVDQMLEVAKERGISIPSKGRNKASVLAGLIEHGVSVVAAPRRVRGVLDVIEGVRGGN